MGMILSAGVVPRGEVNKGIHQTFISTFYDIHLVGV
jgi:hypothetical protein